MIEQVDKFQVSKNTYTRKQGEPSFYASTLDHDLPIGYDNDPHGYLHSDGVIRRSTQNLSNGKYTGYFSTIEEVKQAIELYNQLNAK